MTDLTGQSAPSLPPPLPSATAGAAPAITAPLTEEHFREIRRAVGARRNIAKASRIALTSSILMLATAIPSIPLSILWPGAGTLLVLGLAAVGVVEYLGYRRLKLASPTAPTFLGKNQLALLAMIVLYCLFQIVDFSPAQAKAAALSPEARAQMAAMPQMLHSIDGQIDRWSRVLTYGFYGLVIVLSIACQGGLAWYYYSRRRHIDEFNRTTPLWIRRVLNEAGS